MNFQEKLFDATATLRDRAATLATEALAAARARAEVASKRFEVLAGAGRELNKVARRHALRLVKENASIAADAGKDVSALARTAYATLRNRPAAKPKARKPVSRRRAAAKAA